ncbi:soyasapogenol B glucuronide galactosyltransferase-like [Momordica charantia]|uniref:Soyasapogenol B glucuronide galactosyltransferase-like n=1 Tax=Momordica charantia TaxID=3673 RepID=A0A6J1D6X1_MOMCH|nr:soyasapogenol B glucuronide galactosyltransferase-like [Momordica charantia]
MASDFSISNRGSLREAAMDSGDQLRVALIPALAPGHMIPLMDIARIFARHGADVTFITTTGNAPRFRRDVDGDSSAGYKIKLHALQLPSDEVGLPPGIESFSETTSMEMAGKLSRALGLLENKIEAFLLESGVDCIVSDTILGWTVDAAARLGIPRLDFQCAGSQKEVFFELPPKGMSSIGMTQEKDDSRMLIFELEASSKDFSKRNKFRSFVSLA